MMNFDVIVAHGRGRQRPKPRALHRAAIIAGRCAGLRPCGGHWARALVSCIACGYDDGRRHGGSRVRRGPRVRAHDGIGHESRSKMIGVLGTKVPLVATILLLATVHDGW
ncbi:hypothetical protein Dimus_024362, partial [Dionaea muscipula]